MNLENLKKLALDTLASKKFEGATIDMDVVNSRLHLDVKLRGSIDLPGDLDTVVAAGFALLRSGKLNSSSEPSEPSKPSENSQSD